MDDIKIKILDGSGTLIEKKVLFTFACEELGKDYIVYENNENEICVASYNPDNDINKLEPIIDEQEIKMVNDVLKQIAED